MNRRKSLFYGRRTGRNVLEGKEIRKLEDGGDMFEDYWTDDESSASNDSASNKAEIPSPNKESPNKRLIKTYSRSSGQVHIRSFSEILFDKTFEKSVPLDTKEHCEPRNDTNIHQKREVHKLEDRGDMLEDGRTDKENSVSNEFQISTSKTGNSNQSITAHSAPAEKVHTRSFVKSTLEKTFKKRNLLDSKKQFPKDDNLSKTADRSKNHNESSALNESEIPMTGKNKKRVNANSASTERVYTRSFLKRKLEKTVKISPPKNEKDAQLLQLGLKKKEHSGSRTGTNNHHRKEIHELEDENGGFEDDRTNKETSALNESEISTSNIENSKKNITRPCTCHAPAKRVHTRSFVKGTPEKTFKKRDHLDCKKHFPKDNLSKTADRSKNHNESSPGSQNSPRRSSPRFTKRTNRPFSVMGKRNNKNSSLFKSLFRKCRKIKGSLNDADECNPKTKAAKKILDDKSERTSTQERNDIPNQSSMGDTFDCEQATVFSKSSPIKQIIFPPKAFTLPSCIREPKKLTTFVKDDKISVTLSQKDFEAFVSRKKAEEASNMDEYDANVMEMADENQSTFTKSPNLSEEKSVTHDFSTVECEQESFGNSSPKIVNENVSNISKRKSPRKFPSDSQNVQGEPNSPISVGVKRKVSGISEFSNKKVKQNLNVSNTEYPVMDAYDSKIMEMIQEMEIIQDSKIKEMIQENDDKQTDVTFNAPSTVSKHPKTARKLFSSSVADNENIEETEANNQAKTFNEQSKTSNKISSSSELKNPNMQSSPKKVSFSRESPKVVSFNKDSPPRTPKKKNTAVEQCATIVNENINSEDSDAGTCEADYSYQVQGQENNSIISKRSPHKDLQQGSIEKVTSSEQVTPLKNHQINSNSSQYSNHNDEEIDETQESEIIKCTKNKTLKQSSIETGTNNKRNLNSSQHPDVNEEIHEADADSPTKNTRSQSKVKDKNYELDNLENLGGQEINKKAKAPEGKSALQEQHDLNETEALKVSDTVNMTLRSRNEKNNKSITKQTKSKTLKQISSKASSTNIARNLNSLQHLDVNEVIHEADAADSPAKNTRRQNKVKDKNYELDNLENLGGQEIGKKAKAPEGKSALQEQHDLNKTEALKVSDTLSMTLRAKSKKNSKSITKHSKNKKLKEISSKSSSTNIERNLNSSQHLDVNEVIHEADADSPTKNSKRQIKVSDNLENIGGQEINSKAKAPEGKSALQDQHDLNKTEALKVSDTPSMTLRARTKKNSKTLMKRSKTNKKLKEISSKSSCTNIERNLDLSQCPDVNEEMHEADANSPLHLSQCPDVNEEMHEADANSPTSNSNMQSEVKDKSHELHNLDNVGGEKISKKAKVAKGKSPQQEQDDLNKSEAPKEPDMVPKRSKKNRNKILQNVSQSLNARKSNRQKYAPVAHWLNQRIVYRFEGGIPVISGIQKGLECDDAAVKSHKNNPSNQAKHLKEAGKKKRTQDRKAKLLHPTKKKKIYVEVAKYYRDIPWVTCSSDESSEDYMMKKIFDTEGYGFGFIKIKPGKVKPLQYMPDDDIQFMVVVGNVEVTFQGNSFNLESKDFILIPRRNAYLIKNVGSYSAILQYSVGDYR